MNQYASGAASPADFTTMRSGLECSNFSSQLIGYGLGFGYSARAGRPAATEMIANAATNTPMTETAEVYGFIGVSSPGNFMAASCGASLVAGGSTLRRTLFLIVIAIIVKRR